MGEKKAIHPLEFILLGVGQGATGLKGPEVNHWSGLNSYSIKWMDNFITASALQKRQGILLQPTSFKNDTENTPSSPLD